MKIEDFAPKAQSYAEKPLQIDTGVHGDPHKELRGEGTDGVDFSKLLVGLVSDASKLQQGAQAKAEALARGLSDDIHGTMISSKEADISLKLVGSIRNKLLDAFHELWRINL